MVTRTACRRRSCRRPLFLLFPLILSLSPSLARSLFLSVSFFAVVRRHTNIAQSSRKLVMCGVYMYLISSNHPQYLYNDKKMPKILFFCFFISFYISRLLLTLLINTEDKARLVEEHENVNTTDHF
jgi:hypothetical protein